MTDSVDRLYEAVLDAKGADPVVSRTARLLRAGRSKIAKKLAEEAVEVVIDAMHGDRDAVVRESADLLYNLVVLWAASGIRPSDVWKEMGRREQLFGIAEKLLKHDMPGKSSAKLAGAKIGGAKIAAAKLSGAKLGGAKVAALSDRRLRHRR
jgi:phosphoribosyl-ATP pyrophosphohydrolase